MSADDLNNQKSTTQDKYKENLEEDYSKKVVALLGAFCWSRKSCCEGYYFFRLC